MKNNTRDICKIKHFIWDFDGTLFDTYPIMNKNLQDGLKTFGKESDTLVIMEKMLTNVGHAVSYYSEMYGLDPKEVQHAYNIEHAKSNELLEAAPMESVVDVLEAVVKTGRKNYIYTHRAIKSTEDYLNKYGIAHYFEDIVAPGTEGFAWKPSPDPILHILNKYNLSAEEVAMVGDRELDLASGRNAGIKGIHYLCKRVPQELVCDWKFSDFADMAKCLRDENCGYCVGGEPLAKFGIKICDLDVSQLILFKEQSKLGRCVVAYRDHVSELIDISDEERNRFFADVAKVGRAIHKVFAPDKVNYGAYGDTGCHLHFHLVPKYKDGDEWGGVFQMNPQKVFLSEEEYADMIEKIKAALE